MTRLALRACGIRSALGLTAPAACAAFRARLDNFTETRFVASDGSWLMGAEVPLEQPWRGVERLVQLLLGPIAECLAAAKAPLTEIPILLCLAEPNRPGRLVGLEAALTERLAQALGLPGPGAIRPYAFGQVGGAVALRDARGLVAAGAKDVIVAGVDSLLIAESLRVFDTSARVKSEKTSNGFIPGEAGAAVLLGPAAGAGLALAGVGFGVEAAGIDSGEPLRAEGLVTAMRQALAEAGLSYADISYRIADLTGEQFYFREAALAQTRLWRGKGDPEPVWLPADGMGHTGAAALPIGLAIAMTAERKAYAPGPVVLYHGADDSGRRTAVVLQREAA